MNRSCCNVSVADRVDACILIDTGVSDESLAIAWAIGGAKYVDRKFEWVCDFAADGNLGWEATQ